MLFVLLAVVKPIVSKYPTSPQVPVEHFSVKGMGSSPVKET